MGKVAQPDSGCCPWHPPTFCRPKSRSSQCHQPHPCPDTTCHSDPPSLTLASCSTRSSLTTSSSSLAPCGRETGSALQGTGTHHLQMLDRWTHLKQNNEHLLEVARRVSNNVSFQVSLIGWWKRKGRGQAWRAGSLHLCPSHGSRGHRAAPALPQPSPSL